MKLFLDDERFPIGDDWIIVRSYDEAVDFVLTNGFPTMISFDHDLGIGKTGYDFTKWLCDYVMDNNLDLTDFTFYVHSQNNVGKVNIQSYLNGFMDHWKKELK